MSFLDRMYYLIVSVFIAGGSLLVILAVLLLIGASLLAMFLKDYADLPSRGTDHRSGAARDVLGTQADAKDKK